MVDNQLDFVLMGEDIMESYEKQELKAKDKHVNFSNNYDATDEFVSQCTVDIENCMKNMENKREELAGIMSKLLNELDHFDELTKNSKQSFINSNQICIKKDSPKKKFQNHEVKKKTKNGVGNGIKSFMARKRELKRKKDKMKMEKNEYMPMKNSMTDLKTGKASRCQSEQYFPCAAENLSVKHRKTKSEQLVQQVNELSDSIQKFVKSCDDIDELISEEDNNLQDLNKFRKSLWKLEKNEIFLSNDRRIREGIGSRREGIVVKRKEEIFSRNQLKNLMIIYQSEDEYDASEEKEFELERHQKKFENISSNKDTNISTNEDNSDGEISFYSVDLNVNSEEKIVESRFGCILPFAFLFQ